MWKVVDESFGQSPGCVLEALAQSVNWWWPLERERDGAAAKELQSLIRSKLYSSFLW